MSFLSCFKYCYFLIHLIVFLLLFSLHRAPVESMETGSANPTVMVVGGGSGSGGKGFEDPSEPIYTDPSLFERSRSLRSIAYSSAGQNVFKNEAFCHWCRFHPFDLYRLMPTNYLYIIIICNVFIQCVQKSDRPSHVLTGNVMSLYLLFEFRKTYHNSVTRVL